MPVLLRSEEVRSDLLAIWLHVAERNSDSASRLLRQIDQRCRLLADNPMVAWARPDLGADLRSFAVGNYLIFYRPLQNGVLISDLAWVVVAAPASLENAVCVALHEAGIARLIEEITFQ